MLRSARDCWGSDFKKCKPLEVMRQAFLRFERRPLRAIITYNSVIGFQLIVSHRVFIYNMLQLNKIL